MDNVNTFEYKGYECSISYWNVTPRFKVDGKVYNGSEIEDVIGEHPGRFPKEHTESMKRFIDCEIEAGNMEQNGQADE